MHREALNLKLKREGDRLHKKEIIRDIVGRVQLEDGKERVWVTL